MMMPTTFLCLCMCMCMCLGSLFTAVGADKVPPGTLDEFKVVLKKFSLSLPLMQPPPASQRWEIRDLRTSPSTGFTSNPGYGDFFWSESTSAEKYIVFRTPAAGDLTPNRSESPRTELVQKGDLRWLPNSGDHTLSGVLSIESVVPLFVKGEVTVVQIHPLGPSTATPMLRIIYDTVNNTLFTTHKIYANNTYPGEVRNGTRYSLPLHTKVELSVKLTASPLVLTVKARNPTVANASWKVLLDTSKGNFPLSPLWATQQVYFRAGCYMADANKNSTAYSELRYYKLSVSP